MSTLAIVAIVIGGILLLILCAWLGILGVFFDILFAILGSSSKSSGGSSGSGGGGFSGGSSGGGGSSSDW